MPHLDKSLIEGLPAFAGLSVQQLEEVLTFAHSARHEKDSAIFSQGEEAHHFYLLLSGHIRVAQTTAEGHQVVARYIEPGNWFGIAVAMGRDTYPATAVAAVDCVALSWPNSAWPNLQSRYPSLVAGAYQTIGSRLQDTQARVIEMSTEQVEQRIAHTILRLVRQSGRTTDKGIAIDFPITRQDIAEMTGTTLHTVSRVLSSWEDEGLVSSGRQKVTVTDPQSLMQVAEHRRKK